MALNMVQVIKTFLSDVRWFSKLVVRRPLRGYQMEPARAIVDSVLHRRGLTFAVVMSRQAGKNELSAQLEAYLMNLFQHTRGASLVKAAPTYKPQTINSKLRLHDCLTNEWNKSFLHGAEGYITRLGRCRCLFFSAQPGANVVGATATVLLECDEAQDVDEEKWSKDFAPMGASTNVTTVFYGTIWTSRTMLARVMRRLREQERADGVKRVWCIPWERVAEEVPEYGEYVKKEMARLGPEHPIIKTQYKLEEIEEAGRLFTDARLALMRGSHVRTRVRTTNDIYALTIDVAGEDEELADEELRSEEPRKDSTVVTVVRVDLSTMDDPAIAHPRYEVVDRHWWTGRRHSTLYSTILGLVEQWRASAVVVDATGVGAGLASFLVKRLGRVDKDPPGLVLPYEFSLATKSDLGWAFLGVVETGRYKEYRDDGAADTRQFWREAEACEMEVLPGPGQRMRWGVADATIHDDMVVSAALVACLDGVEWSVEVPGDVIHEADHIAGVDRGKF